MTDQPPARSARLSRLSDHRIALPLLLWAVWALAFVSTGHRTWLAFGVWQMLPEEALRTEFLRSIFLLHSQPPAMNVVTGVIMKLADGTALPETFFATLFTMALQAAVALLWYRLAWAVSGSRRVAAVIVALPLTTPFLFMHSQVISYTTMVPPLMALVLGTALRLDGSTRRFLALAGSLCLLVYTRALWHPLFAMAFYGACTLPFLRRAEARRAALAASLALLIPVGGWIAKNQLLFNSPGFSSWTGINLGGTRTVEFFKTGTFDRNLVREFYTPEQLSRLENRPATGLVRKGGSLPKSQRSFLANGNHYAVPPLSALDAQEQLERFRSEPGVYLDRLRTNLLGLNLPLLSNPYSLDRWKGRHQLYKPGDPMFAWVTAHDLIYHGTWLGEIVNYRTGGIRWRLSLFSVLFVFALMMSARRAFVLPDCLERRFLSVGLLAMGWFLAMTVLVDGAESARMRWEVEQVWLLMLLLAAREAARRISAWQEALP